MSAKFQIEKISGQFTQQKIAELFGVAKSTISEHLSNIFETGELDKEATVRKFRTVQPEGEQRTPRDTTELHECMKAIYNPVTLTVGNKTRVIAGTTTDLNNKEFIGEFLESIISDHSGPPYNIEFIGYEDWKELHRANAWINFKNTYKK